MNSKDARRANNLLQYSFASLFSKDASYRKKLLNALKKMDYPCAPTASDKELASAVEAAFDKVCPFWNDSSDKSKELIDKLLK